MRRGRRPGWRLARAVVWGCFAAALLVVLLMLARDARGADCRPAHWPPQARSVVPLRAGELRLLAQTIYAEARGGGVCSMAAVAWVVVNRMRDPDGRFGRGLRGVVHRPHQFTVWSGDRSRLLAVGAADPSYVLAHVAAGGVLTGMLPDPTAGATHFVNLRIPRPPWSRRMRVTATVGGHVFFRD